MRAALVCTVAALAVALASVPSARVSAANAVLTKYLFTNSPSANPPLCNDGSTPGMWAQFNASSTDWVFHLQGGYWCWDVNSCLARQKSSPAMTGSGTWPDTVGMGGVFSDDPTVNPSFAYANKVMLGYCSSDSWIGAGLPADNALGWYFQGAAIISDALFVLANDFGLAKATRMLYTGCSAGGQGVVLTANSARAVMDVIKQSDSDFEFWPFADAGWLMDETPINPRALESLNAQLAGALPLWTGAPDPACGLGQPMHPQQCLFTSVAALTYPYARQPGRDVQPLLVQAEQYDQFQLPYNTALSPPYTTNATLWQFVQRVRSDFQNSMANTPPGVSTFSGGCWGHCLSLDDYSYTAIKINDTYGSGQFNSLSNAVERFIKGESFNLVERCDGWNCGTGCYANASAPIAAAHHAGAQLHPSASVAFESDAPHKWVSAFAAVDKAFDL